MAALCNYKVSNVLRSKIGRSLYTSAKCRRASIKSTQIVLPMSSSSSKTGFIFDSINTPQQYTTFTFRNRKWTAPKLAWKIIGGVLLGGFTFTLLKNVDIVRAEDGVLQEELTDHEPRSTKGKGTKTLPLQDAIKQSQDLVQRIKDEAGSPGLTIAVSVGGQTVWAQGLGYADVENRILCTPDTILRIASISKPITMAAVARLWESGDLDLDKPVQFYVPTFPEKYWDGEKVPITTRMLLSHMAGIRGYDKEYIKEAEKKQVKPNIDSTKHRKPNSTKRPSPDTNVEKCDQSEGSVVAATDQSEEKKSEKTVPSKPKPGENYMKEFHIKDNYSSVGESLNIFKADPLVHKPGTKFLYTTHGWTLVSAVVEGAAKTTFEKHMTQLLRDLGLENTHLEYHQPLVYNRGRHYVKNENGRLVNAPYVDLSYKWAGGGFISNVIDILKFGNIMLYSYQATGRHGNKIRSGKRCTSKCGKNSSKNGSESQSGDGHVKTKDNATHNPTRSKNKENIQRPSCNYKHSDLPGYLKPETVQEMWSPVENAAPYPLGHEYGCCGMGWFVGEAKQTHGYCRSSRYFATHTGGAVGASSVLLILPPPVEESIEGRPPQGVVVAIICNMNGVGLSETALEIAKLFEIADLENWVSQLANRGYTLLRSLILPVLSY